MKKQIISKIVIVIFFFVLLYIFKRIGMQEIIHSIGKANLFYVIISFLAIGIMFLFWSLRLKFLLKSKLSIIKLIMLNLVGSFICMITPSAGAGGEPVKAYYISKMEKRPFSDTFVTVILDKAVFNNSFFILAIITSLIYAFLAIKIPLEIKTFFVLAIFIILIAIFIGRIVKANWESFKKPLTKILMRLYRFKFINKRFKSFEHFKSIIKNSAINLLNDSKKALSSKKILIPAALYTIIAWAFFYFSFYAIFLAINVPIGIIQLFVIITLSKIIGDLAFIPGGLGITESSLLGLFILFSVNPVAAATVTIIQRGLYYIYSLILGYIFFSYMDIKNKQQ